MPSSVASSPNALAPHQAERLYHVDAWGNGYFFVNERGHVAVAPAGPDAPSIDLFDAVQALRRRGLSAPFMLRFPDLLRTRVERLQTAFQDAIDAAGYEGAYQGVYPIKVNQQRAVVEEILAAGRPYRFGLECGSKAELAAALPHLDSETLLVCNGCKDLEMMRLLARAQRAGLAALPVLERYREFEMLRQLAGDSANGQPGVGALSFGVRARLSTSGAGLWSECSGERSKFGLSFSELLALAEALFAETVPLRFALLHFHLGSQISDLASIATAVEEAARLYAALRQRGLPIEYLDIGGGLGVPYEAGNPEAPGWLDYTLDGYAHAVVGKLKAVCKAEKVPPPTLISESGRALTAYHALLVTEVLEARPKPLHPGTVSLNDDDPPVLRRLGALLRQASDPLPPAALLEIHRRAEETVQKAAHQFRRGDLTLEAKARAERLHGAIAHALLERSAPPDTPNALEALGALLHERAGHYLCDFSVFRSIPDHWALGQRFPIMPIHRLLENPTRHGTLIDLTCDSDGAVTDFVTPAGTRRALPLHALRPGEPYYLGFFLLGAYQDTLGDRHNLFGHPAEAHLRLDPDAPEGFCIEEVRAATSVAEQLSDVRYNPDALRARLEQTLRRTTEAGRLSATEADALRSTYTDLLKASTYLNGEAP